MDHNLNIHQVMLHINITKALGIDSDKGFLLKVSLYKPIQNMTPCWAIFGPRAIIRTSIDSDKDFLLKVSLYKPIQNMTPCWAIFGPRAIIRTSLVEDY